MPQRPAHGTDPETPTLIEVWASSCSSCEAMEPDLLAVANHFDGRVTLQQVNAAVEPARARELRAMATPTLIGLRNGVEVFRSTGRASRSELEAMFSSLEIDEHPTAPIRRSEVVLAVGAGFALLGFGLVAGPSIPLLVIGAVVLSAAFLPHVRRWRAHRS